jgi:hypothetical protein
MSLPQAPGADFAILQGFDRSSWKLTCRAANRNARQEGFVSG